MQRWKEEINLSSLMGREKLRVFITGDIKITLVLRKVSWEGHHHRVSIRGPDWRSFGDISFFSCDGCPLLMKVWNRLVWAQGLVEIELSLWRLNLVLRIIFGFGRGF
jgi:hypothetical protein